MIQLDERQYSIILEPLRQVNFNTLFVRSVIAGHTEGKIFVNSVHNPKSFYVVHSYGKMSLLFGDADNRQFNNDLFSYFKQESTKREFDEWLQAYPRAWDSKLQELVSANIIKQYSRLNFSFDKKEYEKNNCQITLNNYHIVPTTIEMFMSIKGSVVPGAFWRNERLFHEKCVSFTVMIDNEPASTAFTSYLHDEYLEIGIETMEKYRGRGLARVACMALINYCLENKLEPVWSCRLENIASANLAKYLGFQETLRLPYYHVPA